MARPRLSPEGSAPLQIRIPRNDLFRIDHAAKNLGLTRSRLMQIWIRELFVGTRQLNKAGNAVDQ